MYMYVQFSTSVSSVICEKKHTCTYSELYSVCVYEC